MLIAITGASRGFGYALAEALAAPDRHILAMARTVGGLEELDDAIQTKGGAATLVPLDLTDETGLQRLGHAIHERWGKLDLWVHAAAVPAPLAPVDHIDPKDLDKVWAVNARATQRLITMFAPLLKGGRVVYVDDPLAVKFAGAYRASKDAARCLMQDWAATMPKSGTEVILHSPAPMPTALRARFFPGEDRTTLSPCQTEADKLRVRLGL